MAKKKDKALKSLKKDVARLKKQNDKLAERLEKTREDQAAELGRSVTSSKRGWPHKMLLLPSRETTRATVTSPPKSRTRRERRAKELDVDLSGVKGTGSGGRILVKDVEAAAATRA